MKASFDEMHSSSAAAREHYQTFERWLDRQSAETMRLRR